jgi:ribosomal protein S10
MKTLLVITLTSTNLHILTLYKKLLKINFKIQNNVIFPNKKKQITILKAPHIHKKARDQYKITYYKQLLILKNNSKELFSKLRYFINQTHPGNLSIKLILKNIQPLKPNITSKIDKIQKRSFSSQPIGTRDDNWTQAELIVESKKQYDQMIKTWCRAQNTQEVYTDLGLCYYSPLNFHAKLGFPKIWNLTKGQSPEAFPGFDMYTFCSTLGNKEVTLVEVYNWFHANSKTKHKTPKSIIPIRKQWRAIWVHSIDPNLVEFNYSVKNTDIQFLKNALTYYHNQIQKYDELITYLELDIHGYYAQKTGRIDDIDEIYRRRYSN